ncbi:MAG: hypothetical protein ACI8QC_000631 [Planctomycetota bacterium]|jgi:hypothetical protein
MHRLPLAVAALLLAACQTPPAQPSSQAASDARQVIDSLYAAFDFEGDREPDWETMGAHFLEGATFVSPANSRRTPTASDASTFLADFKTWVRTGEFHTTGLHERVLCVRIELFGGIAHAWVAFEGFLPTNGEVQTRGLDSIQLARDLGQWKLVSFSTQYASQEAPLPERFLLDG